MVAIHPVGRPELEAHANDIDRSRFRPDLEGLRAIAVLLVALDHANIPGLQGGFIGVDVFFVISGFLITGLLLGEVEKRGHLSFADFYARRVRRILPLAAFVTVLVMLISYPMLGVAQANTIAQDGTWTALFLGNIHFASVGTDYFARGSLPSPLQHYWSLGVEEQFYVLWPVLVGVCALAARQRRRVTFAVLAVGCIVSLVWSIHQTGSNPTWAYFSPFTRAFELGLGALIANSYSSHRMGRAGTHRRGRSRPGRTVSNAAVAGGIAAILISATTFNANSRFPGYIALVPVLGACAVIIGGSNLEAGGASAILGMPMLRFVGERSYSFYLWHYPFLILAAGYVGYSLGVGWNLLLLMAAFLVSCLSFQFLENPVRHSRWLRRKPAGLTLVFGVALVIAVVGVAKLLLAAHAVHFGQAPTPTIRFP